MIFSLMLAIAATATGSGAAPPSFDCAQALSSVEAMICADPALAARDRALAVAYRHVRSDHSVSRPSSQAQWLAARNSCRTADCVAAAYDRRLEESLGDVARLPAGFTRSGQPGTLAIVDLGGGWHLFEIAAQYFYPHHDNVNTGGSAGVVRIADGRGGWRRPQPDLGQDCILDFTRRAGGWSVRQINDCGNGLNVILDGFYRPLSRARPRR